MCYKSCLLQSVEFSSQPLSKNSFCFILSLWKEGLCKSDRHEFNFLLIVYPEWPSSYTPEWPSSYTPEWPSTQAKVCACMLLSRFSHVRLFATLWTVALQALLSMGFSRQEYCSWLSYPPGDLPDPGIEPAALMSPALEAGSLSLVPPGKPTQTHSL